VKPVTTYVRPAVTAAAAAARAASSVSSVSKTPPAPEKHLELVGDALALVEEPQKAPGLNPYDHADAKPSTATDGPKTLSPADMRRLSQKITSTRTWTPPKKAGASPRLAALVTDLERVLGDLALVSGPPPGHTLPDFLARLSDAERHIEDAIDCLIPPEDP